MIREIINEKTNRTVHQCSLCKVKENSEAAAEFHRKYKHYGGRICRYCKAHYFTNKYFNEHKCRIVPYYKIIDSQLVLVEGYFKYRVFGMRVEHLIPDAFPEQLWVGSTTAAKGKHGFTKAKRENEKSRKRNYVTKDGGQLGCPSLIDPKDM